MSTNVGDLRSQTALCASDNLIEIVPHSECSPELAEIVRSLEVIQVFPDTVDGRGRWTPTFKIKVRLRSKKAP